MDGSTVAIVVVPIVVAVTLFAWIALVFRADRHPEPGRRGGAPDQDIAGSIFRGDPRQQSPRRDAPPRETVDDQAQRARR